jgi:hypothetical protein
MSKKVFANIWFVSTYVDAPLSASKRLISVILTSLSERVRSSPSFIADSRVGPDMVGFASWKARVPLTEDKSALRYSDPERPGFTENMYVGRLSIADLTTDAHSEGARL